MYRFFFSLKNCLSFNRQFFSRLSRNYFHTWNKPMSLHWPQCWQFWGLYLIFSSRDQKSSRIDTKSDGQDPPPRIISRTTDLKCLSPSKPSPYFYIRVNFGDSHLAREKPFKFSGFSLPLSPKRRLSRL